MQVHSNSIFAYSSNLTKSLHLCCLQAALLQQCKSLPYWLMALQGENCLHYDAKGLRLEAVKRSIVARNRSSEDTLVSAYTRYQEYVLDLI